MKDIEIGYLAGLVDGEGSICWRGGKYHAPDLAVANNDIRIMEWCKIRMGGSYSTQRAQCALDCKIDHIHKRSIIYKWHLTGYAAVIVLRNILPYLVIKQNKALEVIDQYLEFQTIMERPLRREYHRNKEIERMKLLGWD
jgi:hypothetical protein